mmetsp:Transcript_10195/g.24759  ORF Transcript_10195/g.24759 Transcript_10195/m.24759 type:complete len:269 (-) Transcript_10195:133-939(-)
MEVSHGDAGSVIRCRSQHRVDGGSVVRKRIRPLPAARRIAQVDLAPALVPGFVVVLGRKFRLEAHEANLPRRGSRRCRGIRRRRCCSEQDPSQVRLDFVLRGRAGFRNPPGVLPDHDGSGNDPVRKPPRCHRPFLVPGGVVRRRKKQPAAVAREALDGLRWVPRSDRCRLFQELVHRDLVAVRLAVISGAHGFEQRGFTAVHAVARDGVAPPLFDGISSPALRRQRRRMTDHRRDGARSNECGERRGRIRCGGAGCDRCLQEQPLRHR